MLNGVCWQANVTVHYAFVQSLTVPFSPRIKNS